MGETVEGAEIVTVYAATTRGRAGPDTNVFTTERSAEVNYASFAVSVPPNHVSGRIEWPEQRIDPATTFATLDQRILTRRGFRDRIVRDQDDDEGVLVFVHGYNTGFEEALYRLVQMAVDARVPSTAVLFAWPSQANLTGYMADRDAVAYSRDALADLLVALSQERRISEVTLLAHSMGGHLAIETVRQLRLSGRHDVLDRLNVVLAAPDIDKDVFRAQMQVIGPMEPPLTVLTSPDDRALSVSNRLGGARTRVGALDINDPEVQDVVRETGIALVDISSLETEDGFRHNRFVTFASLYPQLQETSGAGASDFGIRRAGAFVFNSVGSALSSPFLSVGEALSSN
ncbi:alpha/beta hydrolase [Aureimonas altamirensis]|nr:alpha/beta fold hydrolase [Aureimonas altamirensis]